MTTTNYIKKSKTKKNTPCHFIYVKTKPRKTKDALFRDTGMYSLVNQCSGKKELAYTSWVAEDTF